MLCNKVQPIGKVVFCYFNAIMLVNVLFYDTRRTTHLHRVFCSGETFGVAHMVKTVARVVTELDIGIKYCDSDQLGHHSWIVGVTGRPSASSVSHSSSPVRAHILANQSRVAEQRHVLPRGRQHIAESATRDGCDLE